ncbi:beta-ketoacyl synthase N-terminal-like domain-containing protein [Pseudonocardia spinosispora]|uniref:beta-ketoacyl synthase N-terminal-like domain-containing protein n=1 Tax=Pseudonocardia spinosispora TaxID=103441 RepID=UPI00042682B3|nr:polyketide synthase [Pseudonocardia spinosispora]
MTTSSAVSTSTPDPDETAVAVIGMALRVPGADDVGQYWENVCGGVESISRFTPDELRAEGVPQELLDDPDYVPAKGVLDGADRFDAGFFGYSPYEARSIDPQQRVFLEACWTAFEDAGYCPDDVAVPVGVFAGARLSQYAFNLYSHTRLHTELDELPLLLGNDKDYLTSRVSWQLGLTGPSVSVATACSTSLVAVVTAVQNLLMFQCDMALAGGVRVGLPLRAGYRYTPDSICSPDGHCRTFAADAAGTVFGDGVGAVLLKRLGDALADGDHVDAVIRGCAVNNDGAAKPSWTGPAMDAQAEVIDLALVSADVDPASIGYLEAHGTGTLLGDPIELAASTRAYGLPPGERTVIGSVKPNIGHLSAAAGVASLVKAVVAVREGVVPPSINLGDPNPALRLAETPFALTTEPGEWRTAPGPRRAGVSSFGMGGTNCHVVIEEAP